MAGVFRLSDGLLGPLPPPVDPDVTVDPSTEHQVMRGWEVTAQAGDDQGGYSTWRDAVMALAAEWGVNAMRLEFKDEWETSDGVYDWSVLDAKVEDVVLPFKTAVEAAGLTFSLNTCYVAFGTTYGTGHLHEDPNDYADFILAAIQHLDATYGLVPSTVEVILEPDNGTFFAQGSGTLIGQAVKATGDLLALNGYTPGFIVPSTVSVANADNWYDNAKAVTGAAAYITTISYHRYSGVSDANLANVKTRAVNDGIDSAMLEWIGANVETLWADITKGYVSRWQQYTLAYVNSDNGGKLFPIVSNAPVVGSRTYGLGLYFKNVRHGAQRIGCTTTESDIRPVAFVNPSGKQVVILHVDAARDIVIAGLAPLATYIVTRATTTATASSLPNVNTPSNGAATISVPSASVVALVEQ